MKWTKEVEYRKGKEDRMLARFSISILAGIFLVKWKEEGWKKK
jgi:hypothetical protein